MTVTAPALSTQALVAGYERDLPIVRGIDFAINTGELVVVLGPNGAGKSTLVKAIAGLVSIHSGTVRLGDRDVTDVPAHEKIRQGHLHHALDPREPAGGGQHPAQGRAEPAHRGSLSHVPRPGGAANAESRPAIGWPAADARRGAGADRRTVGAHPR